MGFFFFFFWGGGGVGGGTVLSNAENKSRSKKYGITSTQIRYHIKSSFVVVVVVLVEMRTLANIFALVCPKIIC